MILTGKQPEDEQQPVESVKLETGTRLGTVKLTVDGKTTDNILIKGLAKKNLLGNLNDKYAAKDHKHKEYLKPSEVNITGTGQNGEVVFTEATPPDTTNGTLTLKMKEGQQFERIIDLPFTGLKHLAFADKLTSYPDEMASSFYNDMCTDLNLDLEFVSTTRSSTINGGNLTIQKNSQNVGGNLTCLDISADDIAASTLDTTGNISSGGDISATGNISTVNGNISSTNGNVSAGGTITATGNVTGAGFVVPNTTSASTKFLLANGGVDSYGRGWYMKRGSAYTGSASGTYWFKIASVTTTGTGVQEANIILFVADYKAVDSCGILEVYCKKDPADTTISNSKTKAFWVSRDNKVVPSNFKVSGRIISTTETVFNIYCKISGAWNAFRFTMLDEGTWTTKTDLWTMYNAKTPVDNIYCFSSIPSNETAFESTDNSYAATAGSIGGSDISVTGSISAGTTITAGGDITTSGNVTLSNGKYIGIKNSGGTVQNVLTLSSSNSFTIGGGTSASGYNTYVDGKDVYIRYGTSHGIGLAIIASTGNIGVGKTSPAYKLDVNGVVNATSYNTSSDERLKDVQENVNISIEDIANAPSVLFKWKDKDDENIYAGTIAQYWQEIAPWAVREDVEGYLSVSYPTLALAASIQCAREIVDLKKRIEKLEERL